MIDVSIVMPTKNSGKYINKAIDSVQKQTFQSWELLICDGGSNDDTIKIINNRMKFDKRIKIVSKTDNGVADSLNKGFSYASGKIFAWLNSDDYYYSKNVLEIVSKELLSQKKSSYLIGDFYNIDEDGKKFKSFISYISNKKLKNKFYLNQIFTGSLFFLNHTYKSFGNFNVKYKYAFEYELISFLSKNYYGKHINKFLSCFRITNNQLSSNKSELNKELLEILDFYNLQYSNSRFLRFNSYINQGSLFRFILYKFIDFFKNLV